MKVNLISKEYPPKIYGGAGVHVDELSKALKQYITVTVSCFDGPREESGVQGFDIPAEFDSVNAAIQTLAVDLEIAGNIPEGVDILHSHTWYANYAGIIGSKLNGNKHILSAHSLEPLRPWKAEQLGGGYKVSSYIESQAYATADGVIAVSNAMRNDILKHYKNEVDPDKVYTVLNGIDIDKFQPATAQKSNENVKIAEGYGVDINKPTAIFVGRITRQKGLPHLLNALKLINPNIQVILCAGAPDTPEIAKEVADAVEELQKTRGNIISIQKMVTQRELMALLGVSDAFLCPSIYEPLGIVNLEAMAAKLPVIATATGGIVEVVVDNQTGYLVPIDQIQDGTGTPTNPEKYASDFAKAIDKLFSNLDQAKQFGEAGYERTKDQFSWDAIAKETIKVYEQVLL
jgi:starch synthase